jgi:hypothetical protein
MSQGRGRRRQVVAGTGAGEHMVKAIEWKERGKRKSCPNFFIFNLFLKQTLNLTICFFIFKSNTFGHAKVRGAAKTRCRATCISVARSATADSDFHVEILAALLSLAR